MKGGPAGPFVYKYLSFDKADKLAVKKAKDLIVDSKLYLASPSDFNDPYDFIAKVTFVKDPVERREYFRRSARSILRNSPNIMPDVHGFQNKLEHLVRNAMERSIDNPDLSQSTFERLRDKNGIACFSEDPRSLLMWSYYAAGHAGICLQFNVINDCGLLCLCHKVNYTEDLPHLVWPRDNELIVDKVILNKAKIWRTEHEVRYVSLHVVRDSLEFDCRALTGIILGCRFPAASLDVLRNLLEERRSAGFPLPKVYKAHRHKEMYKVYLSRAELDA